MNLFREPDEVIAVSEAEQHLGTNSAAGNDSTFGRREQRKHHKEAAAT